MYKKYKDTFVRSLLSTLASIPLKQHVYDDGRKI